MIDEHKITIYDGYGNLFRHKSITVRINDITYKAKTNSDGEYHFDLNGYDGIVEVEVSVDIDDRNMYNMDVPYFRKIFP